jgi:hypothetical protein
MRKLRIALGIIISDIGGIVAVAVPLILILSFTNFTIGQVPGLTLLTVILILLIALSLFIIPFQLILIIAQVLRTELNKYGIFSIAIIGGLIGGGLLYFLIFSHLTLTWINFLDYALLGVIQSLIIHIIYHYIPADWKIQPVE